mmetsp:Transcript_43555/g.85271  ORF Transcript_43555/g.85271 Transcript_43555/m.85271 type:complete len:619 (+) Transcript_43555:36-1892(+)|eukprot:CAMPEP_0175163758 /NCGR_PEP_ID=MMETSP0087-20121206/25965_1 /TAXON_ID=136419 /ORGANISM="Unknown Unknown, Strain D1" /LENGTH=618 /DNA_ID=CAMNT_0016452573 /DNA_START=36 /DNA_END=1892 /DNA_ORIENTATION=-
MSNDNEGKTDTNTPPLQFVVRTAERKFHVRSGAIQDLLGEEKPERDDTPCSEEGWMHYTKDGKFLSVIKDATVDLYSSEDMKLVQSLECKEAMYAEFSPLGTFLVTFQRRIEKVLIWDWQQAKVVRELTLKDNSNMVWPAVQWSGDEKLMCHMVTNTVNVYDGKDCSTKVNAIKVQNIKSFCVSPSVPLKVASFIPPVKGKAAGVLIHEYPNVEAPTASQTFFNCTSCIIKWSPTGNGVLINTKTDVDSSNQSYYGESGLSLLLADGSLGCQVPFGSNKGPVHCAEWSPSGRDFIVIQGQQPAKTTLFLANNCTPIRDFGTAPRNTVVFSPHGRFVCIAGFGNLAGEMDFWEKNKFKKMGSCQDLHGAKSFEWTPDGRNFVTSVLWPKRRVDNGIKVWTYYGELVKAEKIHKLAQVAIRTALEEVYPNRPMSPRLNDKRLVAEMAKEQEATKPKAYIPPHLRGRVQAAAVGSKPNAVELAKAGTGPRKLNQLEQQASAPVPVENTNAAKNKARRERLKAKKEKEEAAKEAAKQAEIEAAAKKKADEQAALEAKRASMSDGELLSRKLKKCQKTLKQMQTLADKKASGEELDSAQRKKLAGMDDLKKEILDIETQLKAL